MGILVIYFMFLSMMYIIKYKQSEQDKNMYIKLLEDKHRVQMKDYYLLNEEIKTLKKKLGEKK